MSVESVQLPRYFSYLILVPLKKHNWKRNVENHEYQDEPSMWRLLNGSLDEWTDGWMEQCDGQVWIWTEKGCKMIQRGTDKRDENQRSFATYVCPLLWASRWQGERDFTTNTVEVRIRDLLNGGVQIIMNKGKIMIIINRLEGGGQVNENAFHSPP